MTALLTFEQLAALTGNRIGKFDIACPLCAPMYNPKKRVLRVWRDDEHFLGFACARCDAKGWARDGRSTSRPSPARIAEVRLEAAERDAEERAASLRKARWLWSRRQPIPSTAAESYLRHRRRYSGPLPASLGYLPASRPYPHALIAAFALADEPEPGTIAIADSAVMGVHLVKLAHDGRDRLRTPDAKVSVGRGSLGTPIVLAPMNDLLGLVIAEGIENGLTLHEATGCGVWASGGASRLPALAAAVPAWADCITVWTDDDPSGLAHAHDLRNRLAARGLTVETRIAARRAAA
jgi:hypothetical protein